MLKKLFRLWFIFHEGFIGALRYTLFDNEEVIELRYKLMPCLTNEEKQRARLEALFNPELMKEDTDGEID